MLKQFLEIFRKDNLLQQAFDRSVEMLEMDSCMFTTAVESLRRKDDARLDMDVYAADQKINHFEREVRRKAMTHLALGQNANLHGGMVLISIVIDIERIGDYTKNIVDLALRHPERLQCGPFEKRVGRIESTVMKAFERLIEALPVSNQEAAGEVMSEHWWITRKADDIVNRLIDGESDLEGPDAVAVALYSRYLKRISAHQMNIASSIVNPFDRIGFRDRSGEEENADTQV